MDGVLKIKASDLIAPNFKSVHQKLNSSASKAALFYLLGGRGSLKSSTIAIEIILGIMNDPDANAIAFRKVKDTISTSIHPTFEWAIDKLGVSHLWRSLKSPARLIYKPTGQEIVMRGLDDSRKVKSIKLRRGYFKYSWFEELDEFDGAEEIRSVGQSVKRGGPEFIQFFSFNPPRDPYHWTNVLIKDLQEKQANDNDPNQRAFIHKSCYLDAPREWLGEEFFIDAEELREVNPLAYDHEYLGIATGLSESVIFNGKYAVTSFEVDPKWEGPYFGADWGFAADPSTLVKLWIEDLPNGRKNLYVEYAIFEKAVELDDFGEFYDRVPQSREHKIYADNSRPETISFVKRAGPSKKDPSKRGFKISAADKWPGSVEDGIDILKSFQTIFIHSRNVEMAEEARLYSYKVDPNTKEIMPVIIDKYNHGWDAIRYALVKFIMGKRRKITKWR